MIHLVGVELTTTPLPCSVLKSPPPPPRPTGQLWGPLDVTGAPHRCRVYFSPATAEHTPVTTTACPFTEEFPRNTQAGTREPNGHAQTFSVTSTRLWSSDPGKHKPHQGDTLTVFITKIMCQLRKKKALGVKIGILSVRDAVFEYNFPKQLFYI